MGGIGVVQGDLPLRQYLRRLAKMHLFGREQYQSRIVVASVVPDKVALTERLGFLLRGKALGKGGAVLHRLEPRFQIRVVVADARTAVGAGIQGTLSQAIQVGGRCEFDCTPLLDQVAKAKDSLAQS